MFELSEKDWQGLERPPKIKPLLELDDKDWEQIDRDKLERQHELRLAAWKFHREMDFRWREGQDGRVLDFLKVKYERETIEWFSKTVKKLPKRIRNLCKSYKLVRQDSYCWRADIIGTLKDGRKVRICTRRNICFIINMDKKEVNVNAD